MTVHEEETEYFFTAYNESLVITGTDGGKKTRIIRDFKHKVIKGREFVEVDGKIMPFYRRDFPFDVYDIDFTKNVENEVLFVNGKVQTLKIVQHIQIKNVEYILLDDEYHEYSPFNPENHGNKKSEKFRKNKKIITAVTGMVLIISAAAILSVFASASPFQEKHVTLETGHYTPAAVPEPTPEQEIPGYFEKTYSWWYDDRADRMVWTNSNSGRTWTMTISISKKSYYRSKEADHSSRFFSTYVNDTLNQEATKQIADKILEMGKKYGYGDFENAMNAASFVQDGLPYIEDEVTTGYRDYWRYPVETLVDGGGDCEDSAILLASILQNMDYEVIVIGLPGHAAVAIKDVINPICGNCAQIEYNNDTYMFLESTNTSEIGYIPYEYYGVEAYDGFA